MRYRLVWMTFCIVLFVFGAFQLKQALDSQGQETFSKQTVRYGSSGGDVYELQGRLTYLGFFHGDIDGQYGWRTLQAVKNFQWKFGLKVDGIVGGKTKVALWKATKVWSPDRTPRKTTPPRTAPSAGQAKGKTAAPTTSSNRLGLSQNDIKLIANAVYGESRGEPFEGQIAVAAVILNRVDSPSFPNTISGVIFQPGAFTAVADGQIWLTPNARAKQAVMEAINGMDPTGNCLYYFNPATATSKWIWSRPQVKTIGKHIFCK